MTGGRTYSSPPGGPWTRCEHCERIVGRISDAGVEVRLAAAGEVTQITVPSGFIVCSRGGKGPARGCHRHLRHPVVCSDDCERKMLERNGISTDGVGIEDATLDTLRDLEVERQFLARWGDDDDGRGRLLILKCAGLSLEVRDGQ